VNYGPQAAQGRWHLTRREEAHRQAAAQAMPSASTLVESEHWSELVRFSRESPQTKLVAFGLEADLVALQAVSRLDLPTLQSAVTGGASDMRLLRAAALVTLATSDTLEHADLHALDASSEPAVAAAVADAVASGPRLATLTLGSDEGGQPVVLALGRLRPSRPAEEALLLRDCEELDLRHHDMAVVCALWRSVRSVFLRFGNLGDRGLASLAACVRGGALPSLTGLSLRDTSVGDSGIQALAAALCDGALPALQTLSITQNGPRLGDASLVALAEAATSGVLASLKKLQLFENGISDAGALALADAIADGAALPSLESLDLDYNEIRGGGLQALAAALAAGALQSLAQLAVLKNPTTPAATAQGLGLGLHAAATDPEDARGKEAITAACSKRHITS